MSATSALENNEDLENVPLVRMEDVQPDRSIDIINLKHDCLENIDNECVLNDDDDSNIGSMVLIQSEDVVTCKDEDSDNSNSMVPAVDPLKLDLTPPQAKVSDSWPTLEILPGGVIKNADQYEDDLSSSCHNMTDNNKNNVGGMMYVCAKCSESFDNLILLVKHVRWHEEERKKDKEVNRLKLQTNKKILIPTCKRKLITELKTKCKVPKKS